MEQDNNFVNTRGNPDNQPLIFIHGYLFDYTMWKAQLEYFAKDYYILSYDIRGFGKSNTNDYQITLEEWVDELFDLIYYYKLNKPVLCGLSLGGYIALRALQKDTSQFGAAILCDTHPFADDNNNRIRRANSIELIQQKGLLPFVEKFFPTCFADTTHGTTLYNTLFAKAAAHSKDIAIAGQMAMLSRVDTMDVLQNPPIPIHLIVGQNDKRTPPSKMEKMKFGNTKLDIIPEAGHLSPVENPQKVNTSIEKFLGSL